MINIAVSNNSFCEFRSDKTYSYRTWTGWALEHRTACPVKKMYEKKNGWKIFILKLPSIWTHMKCAVKVRVNILARIRQNDTR